MVSSILIVVVLGIINVGGLTEVWNRAVGGNRISPPEYAFQIVFFCLNYIFQKIILFFRICSMSLNLMTRVTFWNTVIHAFCVSICQIGFSQSCVQRLASLPTLKEAQKTMYIYFFGFAFILSICGGLGLIIFAYYSNCDPVKANIVEKYDELVPRFVMDVAGHMTGMTGRFEDIWLFEPADNSYLLILLI